MLNFFPANSAPSSLEVSELEDLLTYLKQFFGVDLTGYKRPSLLRRTRLRMQRLGTSDYSAYVARLQQQPDEVNHLLSTVFINYTYFFRDPSVWGYLRNQIIPKIVAAKAPDEPIRVWSAGCASGEETYSLAISLAEVLGINAFLQRVQIYGTDVDPEAVLQAHRGCYPHHAAEVVLADFLEKYFEYTEQGYCWRSDLAGPLQFYTHNLIQSPPPSQIDLLVCRNTLMYFTVETQFQALKRFYSSLNQGGFLLLGKAENLITPAQRELFTPVHRQVRVYQKNEVDRR